MENFENEFERLAQQRKNEFYGNNVQPIAAVSTPTVTSMADLCRYREGNVVELPPFAQGQPFVAKLRRPSLLSMVKSGKIPNQLMKTAMDMFDGGNDISESLFDDSSALGNMMEVMDIMCEASLISPTFEEIKSSGMELSDEQKMAIFQYSQTGIANLNSFR